MVRIYELAEWNVPMYTVQSKKRDSRCQGRVRLCGRSLFPGIDVLANPLPCRWSESEQSLVEQRRKCGRNGVKWRASFPGEMQGGNARNRREGVRTWAERQRAMKT